MSSIPINKFKPVNREQPTQQAMDKKLQEVSQLYEKQFLRMMMKEMRNTVKPSGLNEPSMTEKVFREKLDEEYVEKWGDKGGIGLADVIYSQLKEKFAPQHMQMQKPMGPLPMKKGTQIKIDNTEKVQEFKKVNPDMSLQLTPANGGSDSREVTSPWDGKVSKQVSNENINLIELDHGEGLRSKISYSGNATPLKVGQEVRAGEALGLVSADNPVLNWQLVEVES